MRVSLELLFIGALSDWQNRVSMPSFANESDNHPSIGSGADHERVQLAIVASKSHGRDSGTVWSPATSHRSEARSCWRLLRSRLNATGDGALTRERPDRRTAQRLERAGHTSRRAELRATASNDSTSSGFPW